jgi:predicted nucleotidyltransferase
VAPVLTAERAAEIDAVIDRVTGWVAGRADVAGLLLVGSVAREAARPDSDVDLVLLTDSLADYTTPAWAAYLDLGELIRVQAWGVITEHRFRRPSGLETEIGLGTPRWASTDPVDPGTRRVVTDGSRILHDPHGLLAALREACENGRR